MTDERTDTTSVICVHFMHSVQITYNAKREYLLKLTFVVWQPISNLHLLTLYRILFKIS
jgi:hypothetical protein